MCNVMPWTLGFELTGKRVWIMYATLGNRWAGKRGCMTMEVYMGCACRLLGVCGFK